MKVPDPILWDPSAPSTIPKIQTAALPDLKGKRKPTRDGEVGAGTVVPLREGACMT